MAKPNAKSPAGMLPWTQSDDATLRALMLSKAKLATIKRTLGRGPDDIRARAKKLDYKPNAVVSLTNSLCPERNDILNRLLTDCRMMDVWIELRSMIVTEASLADIQNYQRLETWQIPVPRGTSLNDRGCAALIAFVVVDFNRPDPPLQTTAQNKATAKRWNEHAAFCRAMANSPMFMSDEEFTKAAVITALGIEKYSLLLERTGSPIPIERATNPYFIGDRGTTKSNKNDLVRGRVHALGTEMVRIFGKVPRRSTWLIAQVALNIMSFSEKDVDNWCKDLRSSS